MKSIHYMFVYMCVIARERQAIWNISKQFYFTLLIQNEQQQQQQQKSASNNLTQSTFP